MRDFRLASVCMRSVVGDVDANLGSILSYSRKAKASGAGMVVFPEMSLTGYSMADPPEGLSVRSPEVRKVVDAADGIAVCFGFADDEGFISQAVAEDGRIAGVYRKTHLGFREAEVMNAGRSLDVIRTSMANIGIQLCWESHFPDVTRTYAMRGADIVLMPTASGLPAGRREEVWRRILPARAYDNSVFVASCNAVGDNGRGVEFGGGAMVLDPSGRVIAESFSDGEAMVLADIRAGALDEIRDGDGYRSMRGVHYLSKRRPELYEKRFENGIRCRPV